MHEVVIDLTLDTSDALQGLRGQYPGPIHTTVSQTCKRGVVDLSFFLMFHTKKRLTSVFFHHNLNLKEWLINDRCLINVHEKYE